MKLLIILNSIIISFTLSFVQGGDLNLLKTGSYDVVKVKITKIYRDKPEFVIQNNAVKENEHSKGLYRFEYDIKEILYTRYPASGGDRCRTLFPDLPAFKGTSLWVTGSSDPLKFSGLNQGENLILLISKQTMIVDSYCVSKFEINEEKVISEEIGKIIYNDLKYYDLWIKSKRHLFPEDK
jgi:hypothetical protein